MQLVKNSYGTNTKIASTAVIEDGVTIGDNTEIADFVIIRSGTSIGANCKIFPHVVIGEEPQDRNYKAEDSGVIIGDNNLIREFCTIHRAVGQGQFTKLGNNNYLMVMAHVGHNVQIGNNVTIANNAALGGYVTVGDYANLGGGALIHQHCRIGKFCMISGVSGTNHDLIPFFTYGGTPSGAVSTNRFALKKFGFDQTARSEIMRAFKIIYGSQSSMPTIIERLETELIQTPEIKDIIDFIKSSKRGVSLTRMALGRDRGDEPIVTVPVI